MLAKAIDRLEEGFIAFLLAAMTILTFIQVVLRYVFNSGLLWALEATTYLFSWLVLFGVSYGVKIGSHIGVDVIIKKLPPALHRWIGFVATLLCMVYAALIVVGGYQYVEKLRMLGVEAEDIPIERWQLGIILPIGAALLFIRFAQVAWRIWTGAAGGLDLADEAAEVLEQLHQSDTDGKTEGRPS